MHHIEAGPAEKSYGIAVAKLAGLPAAALKAAQKHLEALEAQSGAQRPQLDMFAPPPAAAEQSSLKTAAAGDSTAPAHPLLQEIAALKPDELTPRQALDLLYRLQQSAADEFC